MKKTMTMITLISGVLLLGACGDMGQQALNSSASQKQEIKVPQTKTTTAKAKKAAETTATSTNENNVSQTEVADQTTSSSTVDPSFSTTPTSVPTTNKNTELPVTNNQKTTATSTVTESSSVTSNEASTANTSESATNQAESATSTTEQSTNQPESSNSSTEQTAVMPNDNGGRSQLKETAPADLLNNYRTILTAAGQNGFTDAQLENYYQQGVQYGDFKTLLQLVATERNIPVNELLNNYYRYNGQNEDGTAAVLPAETMQAYRNAITLAGLDASSFSDAQLNGYYHEAHLMGDFGTLLRFVARDRGLNADQLLATYMQNANK